MGAPKLRRLSLIATIIAGSQLGHGIAYCVRFGAGAAGQQSAGTHAYYPAFTGMLSAATGGTLMACLIVVAIAHLVRGAGPGWQARRTTRIGDVLPVLFTAQLLLFVSQETIECLASNRPITSPVEDLIWGVIGQLPAALVAAVVLTWLTARMEGAWEVLLSAAERLVSEYLAPAGDAPRRRPPLAPAPLASAFPRAFRKRGPPTLHRSSVL